MTEAISSCRGLLPSAAVVVNATEPADKRFSFTLDIRNLIIDLIIDLIILPEPIELIRTQNHDVR